MSLIAIAASMRIDLKNNLAPWEKISTLAYKDMCRVGVSWPSGLAYRTQVLVLAAECGFESRP